MSMTISIREAILKALQFKKTGDEFSLIQVTEMVTSYREKLTTDGSVSRRLREFNAGKHDAASDIVFRWDVVRDGVYKIIRMDPKSVTTIPDTGIETVYMPPPAETERMKHAFKPVEGDGDYRLF